MPGKRCRPIKRDRIRHYRCVATSAVRESKNGGNFIERVKARTGIDVHSISGSEEARLVHMAVKRRVPLDDGQWLIVDIGGGSVEVSLCDANGILWSESHTMGTIRLLEELTISADEPGRFNRLLTEYVSTLRIPPRRDTAGRVALLPRGAISKNSRNSPAGARLNPESGASAIKTADLRSLVRTLSRMSYRERVENLKLRPHRADVILPAAVVYERIAAHDRREGNTGPRRGRQGRHPLRYRRRNHVGEDHRKRVEESVMSASLGLGRRYFFDEAHGTHVMRLALSLFDQTAVIHGLGHGERLILMAAALLHDIGSFISFSGHHKHSLYILSQSELPGLDREEMLTVANVARYHRKSAPREKHELFVKFTPDRRDVVTKLAAILRIADALDQETQPEGQ